MDWIDNFYSNNFKNMFEKLIESLDFDLLVKEMNDANMNSLERLLKFIVTDLSNGASYKLKQN
jgi:NADPH-dependent 7-cyano-7-deazaguanine reductase QueF-like protein